LILPFWESPVVHNVVYFEPVKITEEEILQKGLGVSDEEVFSMYKVGGSRDVIAMSEIGKFGYYFPLLDADILRAYGMREHQAETKLCPYSSDNARLKWAKDLSAEDLSVNPYDVWGIVNNLRSTLATTKIIEEILDAIKNNKLDELFSRGSQVLLTGVKRNRVWRWNRYNQILESGQITIKGRDIRVGSKVELPEEFCRGYIEDGNSKKRRSFVGMEFYCVDAEQRWQFGQPWTTTLALTRGHNKTQLQAFHDQHGFGEVPRDGNNIFVAISETGY